MGQVPKTRAKQNYNMNYTPLKKKVLVFFHFFAETLSCEPLLSFPSTSWTSHSMAQRPIWVVNQYWRSYPVKGANDAFLFFGLPCRIAKLHRKHQQRVREACNECTVQTCVPLKINCTEVMKLFTYSITTTHKLPLPTLLQPPPPPPSGSSSKLSPPLQLLI